LQQNLKNLGFETEQGTVKMAQYRNTRRVRLDSTGNELEEDCADHESRDPSYSVRRPSTTRADSASLGAMENVTAEAERRAAYLRECNDRALQEIEERMRDIQDLERTTPAMEDAAASTYPSLGTTPLSRRRNSRNSRSTMEARVRAAIAAGADTSGFNLHQLRRRLNVLGTDAPQGTHTSRIAARARAIRDLTRSARLPTTVMAELMNAYL
jgi:hypothetical protein